MGLEEYLNLPCEDVTSEVYALIIDFSENEQNAVELERLWESSEDELQTKKSMKIWDAIIAQQEMIGSPTTQRDLNLSKPVSDLTWKVA